ncbi:hypothetical protein BGZ76_003125 [Entomortierella beljakovae]|nr:hypothetical protein BGZ76_003125 [Entomortierella beljakovae]
MCQRIVCRDCGKFTWTVPNENYITFHLEIGCGLHISEVLAGLSIEEVCSCDDDRDSEHSWATLANKATSSQALVSGTSETSHSEIQPRLDPTGHCIDPPPIEYKLSKISSDLADAAVSRMAQQASAMEELKKIKEAKEKELKEKNVNALNKLIQGLE